LPDFDRCIGAKLCVADIENKNNSLKTMFEQLSQENQSYILGQAEGLREAQRLVEDGSNGSEVQKTGRLGGKYDFCEIG
jgi:hypothetical protein